MSDVLLELAGLWHERGDRELYGGLSCELRDGELLQVRGPNGHGKTTLLRILAGLIRPDAGRLRWRGGDFASRVDESPAPIAFLGERPGWTPGHSVAANWAYLRALRGSRGGDDAPLPQAWRQRPWGALSTGQRKRAALQQIASSGAALWLLDEPFSGLDRERSAQWQQQMRAAADAGTAVVFVSHEVLDSPPDRHLDWGAAC